MTMRRTKKQVEIMELILSIADQGRPATYEDLTKNLSYAGTISQQAMHSSIRKLISYGYLSKKNGVGNFAAISPTPRAYEVFRPSCD